MKRLKFRITFCSLVLFVGFTNLKAQNSIETILLQIEQNNKELKANNALINAQKLEAQTINNLPDPQLSYAHVWNSKNNNETIGELEITQSFDFPSLYFARNKVKNLHIKGYNYQIEAVRQSILLKAKSVCLDLKSLQQQKEILKERLTQTQKLYTIYQERLDRGDANILETNKIKLELLNATTEWQLKEKEWKNKQEELWVLNGNIPIENLQIETTRTPFPQSFEEIKQVFLNEDYNLLALHEELKANQKQITVNRSQWLPSLELGYKRNTEAGVYFNGIVVGFSVPIFANRNKTKKAKAEALNTSLLKEVTYIQLESDLKQAYKEAEALNETLKAYDDQFVATSDLTLLYDALNGGQLSLIDFFTETSIIYQSQLNYITLENQYEKALALIYKYKL